MVDIRIYHFLKNTTLERACIDKDETTTLGKHKEE
jgi:hypothetical protein